MITENKRKLNKERADKVGRVGEMDNRNISE